MQQKKPCFGTVAILQAFGLLVTLTVAGHARAEAPTKEIVEKVLKASWEVKASPAKAGVALTLNSVKFGKPYQATVQEVQGDGIPEGATVTPAEIDFTNRTFYTDKTEVIRRVRVASVYKDKFDEWAVMIVSAKGEDQTTSEPAKK